MTTLEEKAKRLIELAEKVTEGPWTPAEDRREDFPYCKYRYATGPWINYLASEKLGTKDYEIDRQKYDAQVTADAHFIAEARNSAPEIAKAYLKMREALLDVLKDADPMFASTERARKALEECE